MALTSPQFLLFVVVLLLAFHAAPGLAYRRALLTLANAVFLAGFVQDASQLLPLFAFLVLGYVAVVASARRGGLAWWVGLIIVVFVYLKRYAFLGPVPALPFAYLSVGLSYILFRVLQLVIDSGTGGEEKRLSPREFFDYTCNFLTFVSGPIERSGDFVADQARLTRTVDADLAYRAFARVVTGYFKVAAVSAFANYAFTSVSGSLFDALVPLSSGRYLVDYTAAVVSYTAYLYFNFAGYMDIVIGIGWLLGMELPENFNAPFEARNLFEFWARWHMTLSEWFKTYLFNPLLTLMASRVTAPAALPYIGVAAFFITFFVMGVWHGSTVVFVIYGLVMGAGVSANKVWQLTLTGRLGKKRYRALGEHWLYAGVARAITTSFFALAVTALWVDLAQLVEIGHRLGVTGVLASFVVIAIGAGLLLPVWDACVRALNAVRASPAARLGKTVVARQFGLGATVLLVLAITSFFHRVPEFVYKAF